MSYDPITKTMTVGGSETFEKSSGGHYLHVIHRLITEVPKDQLPDDIKNDWITIKSWLGLKDDDITPEARDRFGLAYQSYLAKGKSPSLKLRDVFKSASMRAKKEHWEVIDIPHYLVDVFNRMLATPKELQEEENLETAKIMTSIKNIPTSRLINTNMFASRRARIYTTAIVLWCLYTMLRTMGDYELFGVYLSQWDVDYFFQNLLLPIGAVIATIKIYNWIERGKA